MAQSRFRVERCVAHNIAVGLCTVGTCKGSVEAKKLDRQLVGKLTPPRCSRCKRERADAIQRGPFRGATDHRPGYQERFCDDCWGRREAREAEIERRRGKALIMAQYQKKSAPLAQHED